MRGRLIYLMGPSGGGKDTVLQGVSRLLKESAYLAPRIVTRSVPKSEPNASSVSDEEFRRLESSDALALAWRANGYAYGISCDINAKLSAGLDVLVNGSRAYLPEAYKRYPTLVPILLDVPPVLLLQRLQERGREGALQIQQRLERNAQFKGLTHDFVQVPIIHIDNSGRIEETVNALFTLLNKTTNPVSAGRLKSCA